jgi:alpha-glucosidase (family GH31 glycosyl hydrolase)
MHQQYTSAMPMMRALVLTNQDDENVYEIADQYMFGDHLMVAPVTTKRAITRSVYLPKGVWFNYWTNEKYEGNSYRHVVAPMETIPLFVKAGSIIPMQPKMNYSDEKPVDVITLDIFPYQQSTFDMYEDDKLSLNYQSGDFAITKIKSNLSSSNLQLSVDKPVGKFTPTNHKYLAKIHWSAAAPQSVLENSTKINKVSDFSQLTTNSGWYYDVKEKILWLKSAADNTTNITFNVNY